MIEYFDWIDGSMQVFLEASKTRRDSMNITTRTQDFEMSDAIDQFVRSRLTKALSRLDDDITAVDVYMKDENGPKGGVDKRVIIRVRQRSRPMFAVDTTAENLYAAVELGVKRTRRVIRRQLRKTRKVARISLRDRLRINDESTIVPS